MGHLTSNATHVADSDNNTEWCLKPLSGSLHLGVFISILILLAIYISITIHNLMRVLNKLERIHSDPRNKLVNQNLTQTESVRLSAGTKNSEVIIGSRELGQLRDRAERSISRRSSRRMSFSSLGGLLKQSGQVKEYEWEIKWKEIRLLEKVGEGR